MSDRNLHPMSADDNRSAAELNRELAGMVLTCAGLASPATSDQLPLQALRVGADDLCALLYAPEELARPAIERLQARMSVVAYHLETLEDATR